MQSITLGQIGIGVAFLAGLISGVIYINSQLKKWLKTLFSREFEKVDASLQDLNAKISEVDLDSCKNYLVMFLASLEKGDEQDDIELERFWETYERYTENGGNTYIKRKVDKLKAEGRL